jgi:type IV pilus assembly protein PilP
VRRLEKIIAAGLLVVAGCGDEVGPVQTNAVGTSAPTPSPAPGAVATPPVGDAAPDGGVGSPGPERIPWDLNDTDFVEAEGQRRDPFRSYAAMFSVERGTRVGPQVPVLLGEFSVDELRVIAIVSGIGTPRAMLIDPQGVGTIVRRGDYVGRGEVVRGGTDGSSEFEVNWRVANIRRGDVVLAREDPTSGTGTPVTRVLPLHPEAERTGG